MKISPRLPTLIALTALSGACVAAEPAAPPQGQPKVCVGVESADNLIKVFADSLREAIAASGSLSLAATTDSCDLQLHVPGNLLRFQTASGVMVSTVVIVTSASGRYLSSSIAACQAGNLKPCALRAVAAAKLALLMTPNGGT
ncbi:MAG TPA: hypothetical protein VHY36_03355 [Steroidobacteraceae bacterium]|nr:hypothetical protein [Steroidobacteraceae bacterium]